MARITKVFTSGAIGPVITYEYRGKPCVRAKPEVVKQTKATKASAMSFGLASRMSRLLRQGLHPILPDPKSKDLMYRLNSCLFKWIEAGKPNPVLTVSDPLAINSFECNLQSELSSHLKVKPIVEWKSNKVIVLIPTFIPTDLINAPANTKMVHLAVCMAGCSFSDSDQAWNAETTIDIPYTNQELPLQEIELPFRKEGQSMTIVAIGVTYTILKKGKSIRSDDKKWLPCAVVGANAIH